jgi:2-polyprenyl-3-methyl-5-hydroxy-6-metoxy-1,4-benzoquinol methylase
MMIDHGNPVTREHVQWAYRIFLDREPESEEAIAAHLAAADLGALTRRFIESAEFRQKQSLKSEAPHLVPLDAARNSVEVDVGAETLSSLLSHVRRCWEFLGQERPHHSVLTNPAFLPDALKETETAFWASGEREAEVLLRILGRHGITSVTKLTCIDFGCGIGRVTAPLADRFAMVHGYDISEPHIEIARSRTRKAAFHLVRELPITLLPTDVFHSRIVLQHNPPPVIAILIRSALACLKPGGIAVFQVPTYQMGYTFDTRKYLERISGTRTPDMEMHVLPQDHIFQIAAEVGCRTLEIREDNSTASSDRIVSNTFIIQRTPVVGNT